MAPLDWSRELPMGEIASIGDTASTRVDGSHPVRRIVLIIAVIVVGASFAELVGLDLRGWFADVWDTVTAISVEYVIAGVTALTVQTTATALGWYGILRSAYGRDVVWRQVLAAYAACVALNGVLPANLGTIVMMVMLAAVIASATFAGMVGGFLVQKIFF